MQYVQRYNLKPNKAGEYQEWLAKNATLLANEAPEGWTYLGTWFTVREFGRYDCESRWELTDYSALGSGFGSEAYQKAWLQAAELFDLSEHGDTALMKSAADVMIMKGV